MQNQLLCYSGSGGTGKSVVLAAVSDALAQSGVPHTIFPSVVRGYYAAQGLADQAAFKALPDDRRHQFQLGLLDYYISSLTEHLATYPCLVICDRSPFDHYAYAIDGVHLSLVELAEIRAKASKFAVDHIGGIVFFPYPAPFSRDVDPDSFRLADPSQNMKIHSLMFTALNENCEKPVWFLPPNGTVDNRALDVLDFIKAHNIGGDD